MQGRRRLGLDGDYTHPVLEPRRDPADETAAADRHQQRVDLRRVGLQLQSDRTLPEQRLGLVVGMDRERAGRAIWASLAASASA